jgi:outer membrane protein
VQAAVEHTPTVREARAQTEGAVGAEEQSLATLLPGVFANLNYQLRTTNFTPSPGINTTSGAIAGGIMMPTPACVTGSDKFCPNPSNSTQFTLGVSQLIWDFQSVDRYRASRANQRAFRATEVSVRNTAELAAESAFFSARAQKALVEVARQTLANQERHLVQVEGFVKVGTQPEIALAQQRSSTATARVQVITAENNYASAKALLNQAMGVEGPTDYDVADEMLPAVDGENDTTDALVSEALKDRPEFKSYREQLEAQRLTVASARGGWFPSLSASASFSNNGVDNLGTHAVNNKDYQFTYGSNFTYVGLSLTWFSAGGGFAPLSVRGQVRQQEAQLDFLQAQLEAVRLQVRVDVEQARLAVAANKQAVIAADEALVNANEQLRLAEGRYKTGVGSIIELGDAQVAQTSAAAQKIQAEFNLSTARAQLLKALGHSSPALGSRS